MINPNNFLANLKEKDVNFFTGVPDSLLKEICACISYTQSANNHVIAANEGAAIGLGIGHHIGSDTIPFVYLQNSGLGNTVNPILSLSSPEVYGIPMLIMIGWRGEPGVKDEPQHVHQGRVMLKLFESMDIPYFVLEKNDEAAIKQTNEAINLAKEKSTPVFLVVQKGSFEEFSKNKQNHNLNLTREDAIKVAANNIPNNAVIVATTGMASRELFEYRANTNQVHNRDFLTVGGMGHANQISLGISIAQPSRSIYCFDGDGAAIMHMGSMAIIGQSKAIKLIHVVFNNAAHDSVGGQPTVGMDVDFCSVANACGYATSETVNTEHDLKDVLITKQSQDGPHFIEVLVKKGNRDDIGRPTRSPMENKHDIMNFIKNTK